MALTMPASLFRCRAGKEQLKWFGRHSPDNGAIQGQNQALTALVCYKSLDNGSRQDEGWGRERESERERERESARERKKQSEIEREREREEATLSSTRASPVVKQRILSLSSRSRLLGAGQTINETVKPLPINKGSKLETRAESQKPGQKTRNNGRNPETMTETQKQGQNPRNKGRNPETRAEPHTLGRLKECHQ